MNKARNHSTRDGMFLTRTLCVTIKNLGPLTLPTAETVAVNLLSDADGARPGARIRSCLFPRLGGGARPEGVRRDRLALHDEREVPDVRVALQLGVAQ